MKKILLSMATMALVMAACTKEDDPVVPEIVVLQDEYQIPVAGTEEENVYIDFTTSVDWTAAFKTAVDWASFTPKSGVAGAARVKLTVDPTTSNDSRSAVIVVTAGTGTTAVQKEFTITQAQVDAFALVSSTATIDYKGGNVELKAMTNVPYEVSVPDDVDWISVAASKAYGEKVTTLVVSEFSELDSSREASVKVKADGFEELSFTVIQEGPSTLLWSVDMHGVMNRVSSYVPAGEEIAGTMVSLAVWGDNLVVCAGDGSKPVLLDKATGVKKGELETGDAKAMYVTNDDAGNLVFCNRVYNYWTSYAFFTVWYMKPGDTTPTKLVSTADSEYYPSYLGAGLSVRGDVTKNAAIAAPWEGVKGVAGENMVLGWNVKNGEAQPYLKITLDGFPGISWWAGYWCEAPLHFPGFALVGDNLSKGGLVTVYDTNTICAIGEDGKATEVLQIYVPYDNEGTIINASGNYNSGCLDYRSINGKDYFVYELSSFWGGTPIIEVYDVATKTSVYKPSKLTSYTSSEDTLDPFEPTLPSTAASVRLAGAEDGVLLYHINNSCSSIEAFKIPMK